MSRRLATDAVIVLERAGFKVERKSVCLKLTNAVEYRYIDITNGTVNNDKVIYHLAARGFDESGYPVRK